MNYYERNPGDKAKHTPHLTLQQIGALVQMEDFCHGTEKLLPDDDARFFALIRARSRSEKADALRIREEFFEKTENGWLSHEIEERIKASVGKSGKASRSACIRWENEKKRKADAMRTHSDGIAGTHSDGIANGMPRARVHKPVPSTQEPVDIGASSAIAAAGDLNGSNSTEGDPQPIPTGQDSSEKKERGGVWLDLDDPAAKAAIQRALGRDGRRGFSDVERHHLDAFSQSDGYQIRLEDFTELLGPFLRASPCYDKPALAGWADLPKESILLKRARWPVNVLKDLANQIDYARAWLSSARKKEKGPVAAPEFDWLKFARSKLGMEIAVPWNLLLPRFRDEILAAWKSMSADERREFEPQTETQA